MEERNNVQQVNTATPKGTKNDAISSPKDEIRDRLRTQRRELGDVERQRQAAAMSKNLLPWLEKNAPRKTLTCFLSYGAEPPTGQLLDTLHAADYTIYVPVCEPARQLSWVRWYPGVLMGRSTVAPIDEPLGERRNVELMSEVDVVLVPAQAVDEYGDRLGQGGGYYDRFIASIDHEVSDGTILRSPLLLSMIFEHEFMNAGSFPVEPFDRRVNAVLTAEGVRELTD